MTRRHRSTHDLISSCEGLLAPNPKSHAKDVLEEVAEQLYQGRNYLSLRIYLAAGGRFVCQCVRGPEPACDSLSLGVGQSTSSGSEGSGLTQPVKIGRRVLGAIHVQPEPPNEFSSQEHAFLEQVAKLLARYLTTDQGKLLSRKARESSTAAKDEVELHKRPQSARPGLTRAAAGEHSS